MLWKIIYLIASFRACRGEFDFKGLTLKIEKDTSSGECSQQYAKLDYYSLAKMIDSSSLRPQGILAGNFIGLGVFDECLSIADETNEIYGKYCLASIGLDEVVSLENSIQANQSLVMMREMKKKFQKIARSGLIDTGVSSLISIIEEKINLGICIPNKCTNEDLKKFSLLKIDEDNCYTKFTNQNMDTGAIVAMSTLYGFLVIAICSTIYDVLCYTLATKPLHPILIAFSVLTNGRKLFKYSKNSDQLECLHGIKALSMVWVILGHTFLNMVYTAAVDDLAYVNNWIDQPISMFILSATVSVDTFFTVGGLLTVYVFMRSKRRKLKENFMSIPMLYLHRYIRLTPALAIMVLVYGSGLIKYFGDGPKWSVLNVSVDNCVKNWWATLIYVQNYMPNTELCVGQSWYLSVDFQLFLCTPYLLFPLRKWPKVMITTMSVLVVAGMIIPFFIGYTNRLSGIGLGMNDSSFTDYYYYTHTRFAPYVIGMIAGYYIYKLRKMRKPLSFHIGTLMLLWIVIIVGLLVCIFDGLKLVRNDNSAWVDGLYLALNRPVWSLMVVFVILLCCTDNGGPINVFLSHPVFQIMSKLSYAMYLVHYIVILIIDASSRTSFHFNNLAALTQFFSFLCLTLTISVVYSLLFESPMIIIEKIIFSRGDKKMGSIEEPSEKT